METTADAAVRDPSARELGEFLRQHRALLGARGHDGAPAELLDAVAEAVEGGMADGLPTPTVQASERHALRRLSEGTSLREVVGDAAGLRSTILDLWLESRGRDLGGAALRLLNRVFDTLIAASAERYIAARDRTLRALDRVSSVAFENLRVDDLLQRLLQAIIEPAASIDTGSILLREGDALVVRAAVGLEEERRGRALRLRIGEGIAGRIAAERRPRFLTAEQIEAEAVSPVLKARKLKALYGVALQSEGQLVGVAHIGSTVAASVSDQDRRLFETMCARATAAIAQHLLQEALAAQVRELETVLQSIPDAVFVSDARGVRHANRAALELFGVDSLEELNRSAKSLAEVLEARHADTGQPLAPEERPIAQALSGRATAGEFMVRHLRTGKDVILHCSVAPIGSGDEIVGAVSACTDITDRKHAEVERERVYRQARQAVADRQHVLGVVSHDLRNPLNTIVLAAETLKDSDLPADLRARGLGAITRAAQRMNRMISDLLDVNSLEAGRLALDLVPQDPLSVVDEVMDMFAAQAATRGLALVKVVPAEVPLVRGDRHRLIQVLANLVSNALKATTQGSVTIGVEPHGQEVVFTVSDTGPGIPEAARANIFEPYWRSERSSYKGTGLGLAIVKGIVDGHDGRVWLENTPGAGATFRFSIPAA
ncbi:MAG TPA: ATP-binding protein [Vicinamibacteria bacterium]|nr:ATP-binding protein [Vicinamibacteria bacterium]